jgi:hypothetical protein
MAFQITCPHCGAITRFRLDQIGQRGSCPKCKNVIAIEPSTSAAPPLPHRLPDVALQLTCRGGAVGCCIAGAITVFFMFVPLTAALTAAFALLFQPQGPAGAGLKGLLLMALEFAVPCLYGAVCGAVLIWLCTFLLRNPPALFEYAWRGAAFGAVIPPGLVFLALSLPLLMQVGLLDLKGLQLMQQHWLLGLSLGGLGAVVGVLVGLLFGGIREKRATPVPDR